MRSFSPRSRIDFTFGLLVTRYIGIEDNAATALTLSAPRVRSHRIRNGATPPEATCRLDRKSTRLNSSHAYISYSIFFFNDTAPTEISTLSLHDALPIYCLDVERAAPAVPQNQEWGYASRGHMQARSEEHTSELQSRLHLLFHLFF